MNTAGAFHTALLTPPGRGAVATVAIWGPGCDHAVQACFCRNSQRAVSDEPLGRILFGRWGRPTGEELVIVRRGVDALEIHCHGGEAAERAIRADLAQHGGIHATSDEWRRRQPAGGIELAAERDLEKCTTLRTASILLDQRQGALRAALVELQRSIEQRQLESAQQQLGRLLELADIGEHLTRPYAVAIAGPPNVGKSQLLNTLLGFERAIVFDQPGTTRDLVRGTTSFDGWPIELVDTAGLHESSEAIEQAGMSLARQQLSTADLVLWVSDVTQPANAEIVESNVSKQRLLRVFNKVDLAAKISAVSEGIAISALTGHNIQQLIEQIVVALVPRVPLPGEAVPFSAEQFAVLHKTRQRLDSNESGIASELIQSLL